MTKWDMLQSYVHLLPVGCHDTNNPGVPRGQTLGLHAVDVFRLGNLPEQLFDGLLSDGLDFGLGVGQVFVLERQVLKLSFCTR